MKKQSFPNEYPVYETKSDDQAPVMLGLCEMWSPL